VVQRELMEPLMTEVTIDELGIQVVSFSRAVETRERPPGGAAASGSETPRVEELRAEEG
jgi:hypothetical protein